MTDSRTKRFAALILLTAVYVAAGKFGLSLAFVNQQASAVWPPTGIALAACLALGVRVWPAIFLGAFVVNFTTSYAPVASIAIAGGNTFEALAGSWLVTRFAGGRQAFQTARGTFSFALLAAVCATAPAALIGAVTLVVTGLAASAHLLSVFVTWWIGDMVGAILVAPPLLLLRSVAPAEDGRRLEAALLALAVAAASYFAFGSSPTGTRGYPLEFLTIAPLLWAAFHFGTLATSLAAAATSAIAVWGTLRGYGPFAHDSPNESLLLLQAFMGVVSVVSLAVAAEVTSRRSALAALRVANDSLEARVRARTDDLVKLHDRLSEAQEVAHVGSWDWDVVGNALWWSEELYRIYGIPVEAAPNYEAFLARVHPDDREQVDATVRQALRDAQPFAFEHRIVRGDGTIRRLSARGRVAVDAAGNPVRMSGVGHDITELKQAEDERAQLIREQAARLEAEEANRAKDQFIAMLSHELRTPINAVLGWAQTLRQLPLDEARRARAIDAIFRNVQIESQLVSDILDVSRITAGTLSLEIGAVNLSAVIDEAVETVRDAATAKNVTITVRCPHGRVEIAGDAKRLRQVVWNLLANSVKFVAAAGCVTLTADASADSMEIVVEDDGPGIDPEFLPHVFDRFRQADDSLTREHGGLGLGLAIVRHIVELHGGAVDASNRTPHGARLRVRLPLAASRGIASALDGAAGGP